MKKQTAHIQDKFLNCLRIQVVPNHFEEQRINSIVNFCKAYHFDNVMLFINSEEYNVGHMTIEEARPWVEAIKRVKEKLLQAGITFSLNPWMELGHWDRGRKLKENQNFVTQCDFDGTSSKLVVCPMDKKWLNYFLEFYEYLIRETNPEVIWIEDDFRFHNHGELNYGGCFCEYHLKAFNKELGAEYSREQLTDLLFRKHPDEKVKKAFLDVNRCCMVELAKTLGDKIHEIGLGTKVGLMSSVHQNHSMEGRDWEGIHRGLTHDGVLINRLHLPLYIEETSLKFYYLYFNIYPFVCRGFLPEQCHVLPELENASFSTFAKDSEALRFQLESSIPLEIEGMTYDIFDFTGNGAIEAFGYGQAVEKINKYLTSVMNSNYSYKNLTGITILLDEMNSYNRPITNSFYDLRPDEFFFGAILQAQGVSARCSKKKDFKNEVIVLACGSVYNFSDEQLNELFKNNSVILEGLAAILLIDRGLGHLIGASSYQKYIAEKDWQSYESIEGDMLINGIPGYRGTACCRTGDYVKITYDSKPEIKSRVYSFDEDEIGPGGVVSNGHLIIPYVVNEIYVDQLHPLRRQIVRSYIESLNKDLILTDYTGVYAYYSKGETQRVLILVNSTLNTLTETLFKPTGYKVHKLYEIERDGFIREKRFFCKEDGYVKVEEIFEGISTKTFIIE